MTQQQPSLIDRVEEEAETNRSVGCLASGIIYRPEFQASPRPQTPGEIEKDAPVNTSDPDLLAREESHESCTAEDHTQIVEQPSHREECSGPSLSSSANSQQSRESQHQGKRDLDEESVRNDRPPKIRRIGGPDPGAVIENNIEPFLSISSTLLCPRCEALDLKISKEESPSFKIIAKLGDVTQLLSNSECGLCQLLSRVRPTASNCDPGASVECSLVQFDGKWARPWKSGPPSKIFKDCSPYSATICFDTFATMDTQIMFGLLPSKGVENPRSNTVPYLHDRLFESITRSGYIRVLQGPARASSEIRGPKLVGKNVDWNFIRTCVKECAFQHTGTCYTDFPGVCRPLKVIDCRSRKVVDFPPGVRYLALSYVWGAEQSAESNINQNMLPDSMPTTILDAMELTLQLGLQHLWVDRYCIPQDQEAVKHREIRHMDLIYRGAAATIVACAGTSPWYGLPGVSSRLRSDPNRVQIEDQVLFAVPSDPRFEIEASNWMSRGWTYQEGLLSKRRMFFTEEQVYFECDARHCFESTGRLLHKVVWEAFQKPRIFAIGGKAIGGPDFYKTVSEYSGRKLTFETDILNGVWGVLRTFHDAEYPIRHYWGVPLFSTHWRESRDDCITGFAWDLLQPAQRRLGFPSWSWTGWLGQVKPGLLVKSPSRRLIVPPSTTDFPSPESNTVVTPEGILQINLPNPVTGNISIHARRMDGSLLYYQAAVSQYSNDGGHGLSHFLHIKSWMVPAILSTFGHARVTIAPAFRHSSSLNGSFSDFSTAGAFGPSYESLEWLPTMDEPTTLKTSNPERPCVAILLATREPLVVERRKNPVRPFSGINVDYDLNEGEVMNNSWLCLFMIVECKGSSLQNLPGLGDPWFERIGLAKFMFPEKMSMQALIQDLNLQNNTIILG
jgi:hypothetical protein